MELDSTEPPGCSRMDSGRNEEGQRGLDGGRERRERKRKRDSAEERERGEERTKDRAGVGNRGSTSRTKLKCRECNSSDLKTLLYK